MTFNGPSHIGQDGTSKIVRTQAMRDYIRRKKIYTTTGKIDKTQSINFNEPSQYESRFKLETWSHKSQKKVTGSQQSRKKKLELDGAQLASPYYSQHVSPEIDLERRVLPLFSLNEHRLDPFSSLSIHFTPNSERLLWYCEYSQAIISSKNTVS